MWSHSSSFIEENEDLGRIFGKYGYYEMETVNIYIQMLLTLPNKITPSKSSVLCWGIFYDYRTKREVFQIIENSSMWMDGSQARTFILVERHFAHIFGRKYCAKLFIIFRLKCGPYGTTQHWTCSLLHTHANALFFLMPILFFSHVVDWTGKERDHSVTTYCISCIRRKSSHSSENNKRVMNKCSLFSARDAVSCTQFRAVTIYWLSSIYLCVRTSVCLAM